MKKKFKIIISVIGTLLILFFTFFITDNVRVKKDKKPFFAIMTAVYKDGGSIKYVGFLYTVYRVKDIGDEEVIDYGYHITTWFSSIDRIKSKVIGWATTYVK